MKTFLYAKPNGRGGLRVVSNISEENLSDFVLREGLDKCHVEWLRQAEVGQHWHAEGTLLLVRTS